VKLNISLFFPPALCETDVIRVDKLHLRILDND
jgi:hypothetical protein